MAAPIELIKGNERATVYDARRADALVADGWQRVSDLSPEKQAELRDRPPSPWTGYDDMTAQEVIAQAEGLPPERIDEIVAYESATKGRISIVNKLLGRAADFRESVVEAPPATTSTVTKQLEAETGHDVVKSGDNPPTFVETDRPKDKEK